jgi:N-acetylglutamate synthase-like GNAT family acetyltransferase
MPDGVEFSEFSGQEMVPRLAEAMSLVNEQLGPESALVDADDTDYDRRKHFVVATDSTGSMIAAGAVIPFDESWPAMITELAVIPPRRREGIGRTIVSKLEDRARELGAHYMGVTALSGGSGFFERIGYVADGSAMLTKELGEEQPRPQLEQAKEPFSFSELADMRDQTVEKIESTAENRLEIEEEMTEAFRQNLLLEAYRFKRVFVTGENSTYFITADDASLRFRSGSTGRAKIQPVLQSHVLIDATSLLRIADIVEGNGALVGLSLPRARYELGVFPFEFDIRQGADIGSIETDDALVFPAGLARYHVGHGITRIIK